MTNRNYLIEGWHKNWQQEAIINQLHHILLHFPITRLKKKQVRFLAHINAIQNYCSHNLCAGHIIRPSVDQLKLSSNLQWNSSSSNRLNVPNLQIKLISFHKFDCANSLLTLHWKRMCLLKQKVTGYPWTSPYNINKTNLLHLLAYMSFSQLYIAIYQTFWYLQVF